MHSILTSPARLENSFAAKIPVRVFVRKIIVAEYGPEPIHINQNNLLGKQVMNMQLAFPGEAYAIEKCYGEPLHVQISTRLWHHFTKYESLYHAGYFFEKISLTMMMTHIRAQVRAGVSAWRAMCDFLDLYDIAEDDYARESAYALWKLYKAEHPELVPKEKALTV